jgi:hypothetical protein
MVELKNPRSLAARLERVENREKELTGDYRILRGYLYILTAIVFVLFAGYFVLLRFANIH